MTMTASSRVLAILLLSAAVVRADGSALRLRATPIAIAAAGPLSIELFRWSTEAERNPLLAALAPPPATPPSPAAQAPGRAAGRAAAAGRGGRGGRGGAGATPPNPLERLNAAVKAAPTVGYIWGSVTGYSIRYAWHAPASDGAERVILVTERRLGPTAAGSPDPQGTSEFTVIEMVIDPKGIGEAKTSLTTPVVVDAAARTLALDDYRAAPALLKVTR